MWCFYTLHRSGSSAAVPIPLLHFFFFNYTPTTAIYTFSLHDALPISQMMSDALGHSARIHENQSCAVRLNQLRSEEHTSELQSLTNLVCRLLLEKKKASQLGNMLLLNRDRAE